MISTTTRPRPFLSLIGVICLLVATACSSESESESALTSESASEGATASADTATAAVVTPTDAPESLADAVPATNLIAPESADSATSPGDALSPFAEAVWTEIAGDETCMCAGGEPWKMWVREADPAKVMLYFQGGGACFTGEMCGPTSTSYDRTVDADDDPTGKDGIFDFTNPENPLTDWSMVFVPYCTGDVHFGDSTHDYGNGVVIEHNGVPNATFAVNQLVDRFGTADEVFVTGSSAGGVPAPLFGGLLADRMPSATVSAFSDGSGAYPSSPEINAAIGSLWGSFDARPDWPETAALTPGDWSIPGLFQVAGKHNPKIAFARHDHAFDDVQAQFAGLAGFTADQLDKMIDGTAAEIEAAGVPLATYLAAGTDHTILGRDEFYSQETNGVRLRDWLTDFLAGKPIEDVHCTTCT